MSSIRGAGITTGHSLQGRLQAVPAAFAHGRVLGPSSRLLRHPRDDVIVPVVVEAGWKWVVGNGEVDLVVVTVHGHDGDRGVQHDGVVIAIDVDAAAVATELHAVRIAVDQHTLSVTECRP